MSSETVVREGLELLLRKITREMAMVESRLQRIARRLGLSSWRELDDLFASSNIDNPEIDTLWPEYLYLRERLEKLKKRRKEVLERLGSVES